MTSATRAHGAARRADAQQLEAWLAYIEGISPKSIAMGLERAAAVKRSMGLAPEFPIITVGGTNGKGSTCAMLEAILDAAGYRVGRYTSPHLLAANERIRIGKAPVDDDTLCAALGEVDRARHGTPLTYFEFGTLAAVGLFCRARVDVAILEVGLGGRLDAVNVFDPDCAVLTSVDLDHMDYLGETREQIGFEKAGIFRPGCPAVCAEREAPLSLVDHARSLGTRLLRMGEDFGYVRGDGAWTGWAGETEFAGLPFPALKGEHQLSNCSAALAALHELRVRLPVSPGAIRAGIASASLAGRFQLLPGRPAVVLDVAHNPHAAKSLAENLAGLPSTGRTWAVLGMLKDKDAAGVVRALRGQIDVWGLADVDGPRGAKAVDLAPVLRAQGIGGELTCHRTPGEAFARLRRRAALDDRIVVFGSFHTVADVMRWLGLRAH